MVMVPREPSLANAVWSEDGTKYRMFVVGGLHHLRGNDRPYFTITADMDRRSGDDRWVEDSGGCLHDEIERHFPGKFSDLIALHLSDDEGVPMYADENGWYWLGGVIDTGAKYHGGNGSPARSQSDCLDVLARHLRITKQEARTLADLIDAERSANGIESAREVFRATIETMRPRWAEEARQCIERHGLKVYGDGAAVSS